MNIKKVDDKSMVIHNKGKVKAESKGSAGNKNQGQECPYCTAWVESCRNRCGEKRGRQEDKVKKEFRPCYG